MQADRNHHFEKNYQRYGSFGSGVELSRSGKEKRAVKSFSKKLSIRSEKETLKIKSLKKDFKYIIVGRTTSSYITVFRRVQESSDVRSCSFLTVE